MHTIGTRWVIILFTPIYLALFAAPGVHASETRHPFQEGLEWYQKRAEGGGDTTAAPEPINRAIEHFQAALNRSGSDTATAVFLLKSYFFKSTYVPMASRRRREILAQGKKLGQAMIEQHPGSAPLKFWYAINLGRWAEEYGILSAAREGVAGTMRKLCRDVIQSSPGYDEGGGYRLLGRVHFKTPYIPLFLTWPSNKRAIKYFQKSLQIAPDEPLTHLFYAEVLHAEGRTEESLDHLNRILEFPVREQMKIEDRRTQYRARVLIERYSE